MSSGRQKAASKAQLLEQFETMYEELYTWREASFDEIASQVTPLRRVLIGELLEQLARQHGNGQVTEGMVCEVCGEVTAYKVEARACEAEATVCAPERGRRSSGGR